MRPTPIVPFSAAEEDVVYEPAEDTYLMLDSLEHDSAQLGAAQVCLEVGCGSGVSLTFLAQIVGRQALYIATDLNPFATRLAQRTAVSNGVSVHCIDTNLVNGLLPRLTRQVDVILFNPPYVVTPDTEVVSSDLLTRSWAGGKDGRLVTDRALPLIAELLSPTGRFYLLLLRENKIPDIIDRLYGLGLRENRLVKERRAGPEHLSVYCFTRGP